MISIISRAFGSSFQQKVSKMSSGTLYIQSYIASGAVSRTRRLIPAILPPDYTSSTSAVNYHLGLRTIVLRILSFGNHTIFKGTRLGERSLSATRRSSPFTSSTLLATVILSLQQLLLLQIAHHFTKAPPFRSSTQDLRVGKLLQQSLCLRVQILISLHTELVSFRLSQALAGHLLLQYKGQ